MADELVDFLLDQLADPRVTARAMFGGHGVYLGDKMFALVYDGELYMKVTPEEAARTEREPFRPRPNQTMGSYRLVSADELEDGEALRELAVRAQEAAG